MLLVLPVSCAVSAGFTAKMTIFGDFGCFMGIQVTAAAQMSHPSNPKRHQTRLHARGYDVYFIRGRRGPDSHIFGDKISPSGWKMHVSV